MKIVIVALLAAFLLTLGCTGTSSQNTQNAPAAGNQAQQTGLQNQQPATEVPPAPPNNEPPAPPAAPVPPATPQQPPVVPAPPQNASSGAKINAAALSLHNMEGDCWVAYQGKVYDVTAYIPQHPGGSKAIIQGCGTAEGFESAFTKKHGTSKVGVLIQNAPYKGEYAG